MAIVVEYLPLVKDRELLQNGSQYLVQYLVQPSMPRFTPCYSKASPELFQSLGSLFRSGHCMVHRGWDYFQLNDAIVRQHSHRMSRLQEIPLLSGPPPISHNLPYLPGQVASRQFDVDGGLAGWPRSPTTVGWTPSSRSGDRVARTKSADSLGRRTRK